MSESDEITYAYLEQLQGRLMRIEDKIDTLQEFKFSTVVAARFTAIMVSSILGFVSLVSSGVLTYLITTKLNSK